MFPAYPFHFFCDLHLESPGEDLQLVNTGSTIIQHILYRLECLFLLLLKFQGMAVRGDTAYGTVRVCVLRMSTLVMSTALM